MISPHCSDFIPLERTAWLSLLHLTYFPVFFIMDNTKLSRVSELWISVLAISYMWNEKVLNGAQCCKNVSQHPFLRSHLHINLITWISLNSATCWRALCIARYFSRVFAKANGFFLAIGNPSLKPLQEETESSAQNNLCCSGGFNHAASKPVWISNTLADLVKLDLYGGSEGVKKEKRGHILRFLIEEIVISFQSTFYPAAFEWREKKKDQPSWLSPGPVHSSKSLLIIMHVFSWVVQVAFVKLHHFLCGD